ncbi:MAG: ATP-binding protein [Oscillospiraceae bacterium]
MNFRKLKMLCAFNIKNDPIVSAFSDIEQSGEKYCEIVNKLLTSRKTLADYLHDIMVYSDSPLVAECAKNPTDALLKAMTYDLSIIKELVELSPKSIKKQISDEDNSFCDIVEIPYYEQGEFNYDVNYFLDYVRNNGCGIFAKYKAFSFDGELHPIEDIDKTRLSDLKRYEVQRNQVVENTICFLNGKPAQNVLLYGDRGTGKSATVKAILNEFEGLRMIEIPKSSIALIPKLFRMLKDIPLHFILTIDDLSFSEDDDRFSILKAVLDGSLSMKPENILIYATTNRRKIIRETAADREISGADAIDESMSLSDRFGLFITFTRPDKKVFLDIVKSLADDAGISISEEELFASAEKFALRRGGRSPRIARQFVDWLEGRLSLGLEY